jgi:hypothetical protein
MENAATKEREEQLRRKLAITGSELLGLPVGGIYYVCNTKTDLAMAFLCLEQVEQWADKGVPSGGAPTVAAKKRFQKRWNYEGNYGVRVPGRSSLVQILYTDVYLKELGVDTIEQAVEVRMRAAGAKSGERGN